jgi:hypothetical protein
MQAGKPLNHASENLAQLKAALQSLVRRPANARQKAIGPVAGHADCETAETRLNRSHGD